ncbi:MAG: ATP-binding cassette domain-containing protein, partial [Gaiellaceae bacterium]
MLTRTGAPTKEPLSDPVRGPRGTAIALRGLGQSFGELEVIARLDLELAPRGVLGVVGPSGCGKSTLLELIAGLR